MRRHARAADEFVEMLEGPGRVEEQACPGVEIERVSWPEDELELKNL